MLDPGKSLSGQLAHLQPAGRTAAEPDLEEPRPRPVPAQGGPPQSGGFAGPRGQSGRGPSEREARSPYAGRIPAPEEIDDLTGYVEQVPLPEPRRDYGGRRRAPSTADQLAGRIRAVGRDASTPGNKTRMIVAVVLVVIVLAGAAVLLKGVLGGSSAGPTAHGPSGQPSATAATPLIPVQEYVDDRGISVNVPKDWTKSATSSYVDFVEPGGTGRKIRINVEPTTSDATKFLTTAETGLKKPTICPTPYNRVNLVDSQLAKQPAAQLEYTCGTGDGKRHGIWQAVVVDGKAYHFYLTVPDARFDESKVIFDEMVRSFHFVS
jgi:hypothetical protein